jgi:hypothetical protein
MRRQMEIKRLTETKAKIYFERGIAVHISLKNNNFYNGDILSCFGDYLMLEEIKLGILPIFFKEIFEIEPMARGAIK